MQEELAAGMLSRTQPNSNYPKVTANGAWNGIVIPDPVQLKVKFVKKPKKPHKIFVSSMSDLFHDLVPLPFIQQVLDVIRKNPQHYFIILTKRAQNLAKITSWPENVVLSVTVGDKAAIPRIAQLQATNAPLKFLSLEPLVQDLGTLNLSGIDWVALGGESGNNIDNVRPTHPDWVRSVRDQCIQQNVKCHFKGWQAWFPQDHAQYVQGFNPAKYQQQIINGMTMYFVGKSYRRGICSLLDGQSWTQAPI